MCFAMLIIEIKKYLYIYMNSKSETRTELQRLHLEPKARNPQLDNTGLRSPPHGAHAPSNLFLS